MVCVIVTYITDSKENRKSTSKQVISMVKTEFIVINKIDIFLWFKKDGKYTKKWAPCSNLSAQ